MLKMQRTLLALVIFAASTLNAQTPALPTQALLQAGSDIKCYPMATAASTPTISPWVPQWSSMIWHWGMHGTAGTLPASTFNVDYVGNGNTTSNTCLPGSATLFSYVKGQGGVGSLNGTVLAATNGANIDCAGTAIGAIANNITMGGWVKSGLGTALSYGGSPYGMDAGPGWSWTRNSTTNQMYLRYDTTVVTNGTCNWQATHLPLDGNWHHIIFTITGTLGGTGTIKLYFDGALDTTCNLTGTQFGTGIASNGTVLRWRSYTSTLATYFAEWSVWSSLLSATDVSTLYNFQNCFRLK